MNTRSFEPGQDKITRDLDDTEGHIARVKVTEGHAMRGKITEDEDTEGHAARSGRLVEDSDDEDTEGHGVRIKI